VAHQLPGGAGSLSRSEMLCQGQKRRFSAIEVGQYLSRLLHKQALRLNTIVRDLWLWCMNRGITLSAEHLPGVLNTVADEESRVMKDRSD
jgi:hypothetical protein